MQWDRKEQCALTVAVNKKIKNIKNSGKFNLRMIQCHHGRWLFWTVVANAHWENISRCIAHERHMNLTLNLIMCPVLVYLQSKYIAIIWVTSVKNCSRWTPICVSRLFSATACNVDLHFATKMQQQLCGMDWLLRRRQYGRSYLNLLLTEVHRISNNNHHHKETTVVKLLSHRWRIPNSQTRLYVTAEENSLFLLRIYGTLQCHYNNSVVYTKWDNTKQ